MKKILNLISNLMFKLSHLRLISLLTTLSLLSVAVGVVFLLKRPVKDVAASWFNDNWMYRKPIEVTNNTSNETNVYISTNIDTSDTNKFQGDCGDLRFTDYNGMLLDYYINTGCGTTATETHINFQTFPAGLQTIYYYYDNPTIENGFESSGFTTEASNYTIGSIGAEEQSPGPMVYWALNKGYGTTANDSTQNNNDGIITGGIWKEKNFCISDKCIYNGTTADNRIQTASTVTIPNAYSLSLWLRGEKTNQVAENTYIFGWESKISLYLQTSTQNPIGGILIRNAADTAYHSVSTGTDLLDNDWHNFSATVNTSTLEVKIYIDGKLIKTDTIADHYSGSAKLNLGSWSSAYGNFTGFIDEAKIYPYVRNAAQVKAEYNSRGSTEGVSARLGSDSSNSEALNEGLVGYWKMDETTGSTAADSSGAGNNANLGTGNSAPSWSAGKFGNGGSFDGNDTATITTTAGEALDPDTLTVSAWLKADNTNSGTRRIFQRNSSTYGVYQSGTTLSFYTNADGWVASSATIAAGQWYHVTGTYDGNQTKIYLDGVLKDSDAQSGTVSDGSTAAYIGWYTGSDNYFEGDIDDLRIYNRAFFPREVRNLYNWAPGPIAHWDFDENTGGTSNDKSGNNHSGTLTNSPTWVSGKFGGGLEFDGSNYVQVDDSDDWYFNDSNLSISFWMNPDTHGNYRGLVHQGQTAGHNSMFNIEDMSDGTVRWLIRNASASVLDLSTTETTTIGQWTHIEAVRNGSSFKIYFNGVEKASGTSSTALENYAYPLYIGSREVNNTRFDGKMDDVKIYRYARTQKQIVEDMNAGHPVGGSPVGSQVGYWSFDEGYGTTVNDTSSQENNGTLGTGNSAPSWTNDGKIGKALSFDGNDYLSATDDTSFDIYQDGFTYTAWINIKDFSSQVYNMFMGHYLPYFNVRNTGKLHMSLQDGTQRSVFGDTVLAVGTWYHVATTYDSQGYMKVFLNGKLDGTEGPYSTIVNYASDFHIGTWDNAGTFLFDGFIDEVKAYNSALTEDEIKIDMNQGKAVVMGALSSGAGNTAPATAASQEYCVPGGTDICSPPVGEWKMDEKTGNSAYDTSGGGFTGSFSGTPSWQSAAKCKTGACLDLDVSDYVTINSSAPTITEDVTIEAWVKQDETVSFPQVAFRSNAFLFRIDSGEPIFWVHVGGDDNYEPRVESNVTLTDNNWYHLTGVYNGSTIKIYVNGQYKNSTNRSGAMDSSSGTINFGNSLDGSIDNVKIYDYARTPAQIAWDYNRGDPIGWWEMDECQGTTAHDTSGNGNDGVISIGATAPQTTAGSCGVGDTTAAWYNGASGKYGSSLNFDGADDYINVNGQDSLKISSDNNTIAAWVKTTDTTQQTIIDYGGAAPRLSMQNNLLQIYWGATYYSSDNTNISDDSWHHVVAVFKDGYVNFYKDGTYVDNIAISTDKTSGTALQIAQSSGSSGYFDGQIDDVRIYNYGLTSLQIKGLFNENSAVRFGP